MGGHSIKIELDVFGRRKKMIQIENITKIFPNGEQQDYALNQVNFEILEGEFVGIVGKSGSGKSTLLNILSGIDAPSAGSVIINGTDISRLSSRKLAKWRNREIGIVFQSFHLLPTLTLVENVMLPMEFSKFRKKKRQRALKLLEDVGLLRKADFFPDSVSGGEKQRTAIARALANNPPLILADEPTGNLDSETAKEIFTLFEQLVTQGKTMVMVTHDQDLSNKVDRTLLVKDGQVREARKLGIL
ncbi:ABC transporter ATP-binding protein [Falsibacillus albus]|uniref:ABC transporter ATP-binding protein n=2 Tax=Falsibacillus albus TaxID=2478915 RepID=A0A3L7K3J3_9BACI|nr:ABC transporter ATP-binding protein [Falsibacillus albus]